MTGHKDTDTAERPPPRRLSLLALLQSVFAAALGVQSAQNRERDFSNGNFWVFVAAGMLATALFIGTVVTVVSLVTRGA